jgi:hypothetical protein
MKKTLKIRHFKIAPIIGFGIWKDNYSILPEGGYCWNLILFCFRIQIGEIYYIDPNAKVIEDYEIDFGGILKIK